MDSEYITIAFCKRLDNIFRATRGKITNYLEAPEYERN